MRELSNIKIYVLIIFLLNVSLLGFGQKYKVKIRTGAHKGAIYSNSSVLGITPFDGDIDYERVETVYVIAENDIFNEIPESYLKLGKIINVSALDLSKYKDIYKDVAFVEIKSYNTATTISVNGAFKKPSFQHDEINKSFKRIISNNELFTNTENATYKLFGTFVRDYPIFQQGLTIERNYASLAVVKWKLVHVESGKVVYEKEVVGGHYLGKLVRTNLSNYYNDQYYSGKKAILNTLSSLLMDTEFSKAVKDGQKIIEENKQDLLTISTGDKFCSSIDKCITATTTIKTEAGFGSGFFISNDGYILTNYHVVKEEQYPTVTLSNGIFLKAKVIRLNKETDVALLKVELGGLPIIKTNRMSNFKAGDDIFVIGTPEDMRLGQTLTKGIISGVREDEEIIQIDASVNRGNSGGPLINSKNEVLGIVTAKLIGVGTEGIGFAISIKKALKVLNIQVKE